MARLATPVLRAVPGGGEDGRRCLAESRVISGQWDGAGNRIRTGDSQLGKRPYSECTQSVPSIGHRRRSQTPRITGPRRVPILRAISIRSQLAQRFPPSVMRRCCERRRHPGAPRRRLGARMEARAACSPCAPWRPVWASPRPLFTRGWRRERCSTSVSPTPSESPRPTWTSSWPARGSEPRLDSSIDPMNSSNSRSSFRRQRRFLATADHDRHSPPGT